MQVLTSQYFFDGSNLSKNKYLLINDGVSKEVVNADKLQQIIGSEGFKILQTHGSYQQFQYQNLGDGVITPGFVDLQVNGCGGVLFNQAINRETLETIYQTWLSCGTTQFLPTLITCDFVDVIQALNLVKAWVSQYKFDRGVLGIHLEGPFISKAKAGIHPKQYIIPPTMDLLKRIVDYRQHFPIKLTIAVEEFSDGQLKYLIDNDIIVAIGHSNGNYQQAMHAIALGVNLATHTFNAMSGLTAREPGVIGAILNSNVYAGVIADLQHVDGANVKLLHKLKQDRMYLVTDAVTPAATNLTEFILNNQVIHVNLGKCVDELGTLAGANLTMSQAVLNSVHKCGIDLESALKMATTTPLSLLTAHYANHLHDYMYFNLASGVCSYLNNCK